MVSSVKNRKYLGSPSHHPSTSPQTSHNSDGRRQLVGLSKAIREKAFQSTFPKSEETESRNHHCRQEMNVYDKQSCGPTLEDRLRSLFNSDTEDVISVKKFKSRSKTPVSTMTNKKANSNKVRDSASFNDGYREHVTSKFTRRCTSAGPLNFNDTDWNQMPVTVSNFPKENQEKINIDQKSVPSWAFTRRYTPSNPPKNLVKRPNSYVPQFNYTEIAQQSRPASKVRRSLFNDTPEENNTSEFYVNLTPSHLQSFQTSSTATPQSTTTSDSANFNYSTLTTTPSYNTSLPSKSSHFIQPQHHGEVHLIRTADRGNYYFLRNPQPDNCNKNCSGKIQQKSTLCTQNRSRTLKSENEKNIQSYDQNAITVYGLGQQRPYTGRQYPQQNFSFRRAVRRSVSSESEKEQEGKNYDQTISLDFQAAEEKSSRKSDDRDSGTVVDHEASLLDLESPIASDEGCKFMTQNKPNHTTTSESTQKRELNNVYARTGTPTLPPLSSDNDYIDVPDDDKEKQALPDYSQSVMKTQRQTARTLNVATAPNRHNQAVHSIANGVAELSMTESAIPEKPLRRFEQKSNFVPTKMYRGSFSRRGCQSRMSSGDEKRSKKFRNKIKCDESDLTDCSTQHVPYPSLKLGSKTACCVINPKSDFGETSSVRSMTTGSVCSSVLRRSGRKRHHHHRRYHTTIDMNSLELKGINKRLSRLESHVVTLAKNYAQLSGNVAQSNNLLKEVELLRLQVYELTSRQMLMGDSSKTQKNGGKSAKGPFHGKRNKLEKVFGIEPPKVSTFLKQLGYEKYVKNFQAESIGMMELPYLNEKRLQDLGIPLGPSMRIIREAQNSSIV